MQRTLTISVFGKLADVLGREFSLAVEAPCSAAELTRRVAESRPEAAEQLVDERVRICVGDSIVPDSFMIEEGRVEILSPVSGG
jgi:molybdopterin converting factor small subunit